MSDEILKKIIITEEKINWVCKNDCCIVLEFILQVFFIFKYDKISILELLNNLQSTIIYEFQY